MNKPVTALCDHCDKITDVHFKKDKHPNGIEETYFKCEHCFHHYTSFVTDKWVRKQQRNNKRKVEINKKVNERMAKLKYNLINYGRADL